MKKLKRLILKIFPNHINGIHVKDLIKARYL